MCTAIRTGSDFLGDHILLSMALWVDGQNGIFRDVFDGDAHFDAHSETIRRVVEIDTVSLSVTSRSIHQPNFSSHRIIHRQAVCTL